MTRKTIALSAAFGLLLAGSASSEMLAPGGGAGNTGATAPSLAPDPLSDKPTIDERPAGAVPGNPSPASVPGSTPGVNIGGTPTSGPPGSGGSSGGPSLGNR